MGRVLFVVVLAGALLGAVASSVHQLDRTYERLIREQAGRHLVELQTTLIDRALSAVRSDLLYLAEQPRFGEASTGGRLAQAELTRQFVLFSEKKGVYDQVRYLDAAGREVVRVDRRGARAVTVPASELQDKSGRYYVQEAATLARGELAVSAFDLNVERGQIERPLKPVIRFSTPCFDQDGKRRGIVVLNYLGARLLEEFDAVAASAGESSMLLDAAGYWLRGPSREDEWGFMLGTERSFGRSHPQAWERIVGAVRGEFLDASGLYAFARLSVPAKAPTGSSGCSLVLVSYLPRSQVYARADRLLRRLLVGCGVVLALTAASAWFLIHAAGVRSHQTEQIRLSTDRLRQLSKRLIDAQEEERARLARDLHDDLGQLATTATLQLQMALQLEGDQRTRRTQDAIESVEAMLRRAREMASWLRPPMLDDLGLKDAVQSYLCEFEERSGLEVRVEFRLEREDFPTVVSENLYRILQEALNNVVKYSGVTEAFVKLFTSEGELTLIVRDEGAGFRPEGLDGTTLGIMGMRERALLLGGRFEVVAAPGQGTEIRADLPLPAST